ncbi:MAG: hypothetical protein A2Y23_06725 [Clostridiales bacterium GWB2_37_7]|nr:MAG: hypothetical protein A2Y23_06725 [Clostridiales bacterium GWB2_37_7]
MNKEEKNKVHKGFNLLDIFIILVIVGLLGGGWYVYSQYTEGLQKNKQAIEYQVEFKGVDQNFVDAISKGDLLRESVKGNNLGYMEEKIVVEATNINIDFFNGQYKEVILPNKLDVILNISSEAEITERSIAVGGLGIKIGQRLFVKGKGYAKDGFILNIDIKE